jgi:uncharacterized membrane protein
MNHNAMKRLLLFLRTTLVGGLLFLVPIVVLAMVVGKALVVMHKVVDPLAEHLPVHSIIGLRTPLLLALGAIIVFCFLAGFFARTVLAQRFVRRLESSVLSNVPGYQLLKGMGEGALGVAKEGAYPVVLVRFDDAWQIGFQIEAIENGLVAVFIPDAPNPQSGSVHLLTPDRITPANVPPATALKCLQRLGAGSKALLTGFHLPAATGDGSDATRPRPPMTDD